MKRAVVNRLIRQSISKRVRLARAAQARFALSLVMQGAPGSAKGSGGVDRPL